jgi:hypothetical protein
MMILSPHSFSTTPMVREEKMTAPVIEWRREKMTAPPVLEP